ncbi:hypothetical protein J5N97_025404 [Dioscorea zingiberensis]|uniref:Uncharacterized protein n=1 Tax=Dioscorea zingiberensis TaxID=325984 RepID=A0A9D5C9H5_9LILI|nr:hypothetical protein J5N97_025404 [Dioscorea zingiberensis]
MEDECEPLELRALRSLGLGFDLTSDFRLRFAKGYPTGWFVELDERNTWDLVFPAAIEKEAQGKDVGLGVIDMQSMILSGAALFGIGRCNLVK